MKRFRFLIMLYIIAGILILSCGKKEVPTAETEDPFIFKVQFVLGDVKITGASGEKAANQGDGVAVNDVITTGKKAVADLLYGKSGVIRISENSKVVVTSMAEKAGSDTVMNMDMRKGFLYTYKNSGEPVFKVPVPYSYRAV
jgi:hypothetical protein